jgi:putative CocE/NonD family hydrolase
MILERNVPVPMRDGVVLRANVYRPETDDPVPALLCRLPYGKDVPQNVIVVLDPVKATEAGYAVVYQDTRGRYKSDGKFYPFVSEGVDGFDSVEWLATQPWCSGAVGMFGGSYHGSTQWLAAAQRPPHLKAIAPFIAPSEIYEGNMYQGGAFQLGLAIWWAIYMGMDSATRPGASGKPDLAQVGRFITAMDRIGAEYGHLPLAELPLLRDGGVTSYYFDWIAHSSDDDYWRSMAWNRRYPGIDVPALNMGCWYDLLVNGTLENFVRMRQEGGTEAARNGQRLLIGPWSHGYVGGYFVDRDFGLMSAMEAIDLTGIQVRFFNRHLKNETLAPEAPVRIFVMGENRWRDEQEWPLARTQYTQWFLHSAGEADTGGGDLSVATPAEEPQDHYVYDPGNPCPTVGGPSLLPGLRVAANAGPRDQSSAEARPDVLVYTSQPLAQALEVTGPLSLTLYAASTAPDTDFVARLCDVTPEGKSIILQEGILRARFREGTQQPKLITPGQIYEYRINLVATSIVFFPGHRIRVDITSSSFPRFDVNTNTGNPLGIDGPGDIRTARQTIFHDAARPSHLLLPVIPRA